MSIDGHRSRLFARILLVVGACEVVALGACGGTTVEEQGARKDDPNDTTDNGCRAVTRRETQTTQAIGVLCEAADGGADAQADGGPCAMTCEELCRTYSAGWGSTGCTIVAVDGGVAQAACTHTVEVTQYCGRAFDGLLPPERVDTDAVGSLFARAAWMEAASITAFRRLARELSSFGAPRELVDAARAAARDEIRHARAMRWLAERHGARVPRVRRAPFVHRGLVEIAIENAREGCIGETYGAALAAWQATHAKDREIRGTMKAIADDELRHAALAHAIHEWIVTKLDDGARAKVEEARSLARAELHAELRRPVAREVVAVAGIPEPDDALALVEVLAA